MLLGDTQSTVASARFIAETASNVAIALSSVVVAILAILGFNAWKRRMRFEVARRLVRLGKQFANEVQEARRPLGSSAESAGRARSDAETPPEAAALDQRYAYMRRLEPSAMTLRDLRQASWEAEASLKIDLSTSIQSFIAIHNKMTLAAEKRYLLSKGLELTPEEHKELLMTLYGPAPGGDRITEELDEAQSGLEKKLKRFI